MFWRCIASPDAPLTVVGNFSTQVSANDVAIGLARTGAFFSNNQAPLTSRTVRFISGVHFPPGVSDTQNADLYGIENTNRGCTLSAGLGDAWNTSVHRNGRRTGRGNYYRQSGRAGQRPERGESRRAGNL